MHRILLSSLLALFLYGFAAGQNLWTEFTERPVPAVGERRIVPNQYRVYQLDLPSLEAVLATAPARFAPGADAAAPELSLPMPDGSIQRFRLYATPMLPSALQARYPDIRTYTGAGIDDPGALLKADLTPAGFHAMVLSGRGGEVFIDPYAHGDRHFYTVYFKKDYAPSKADTQFSCATGQENLTELQPGTADADKPGSQADFVGDCRLRTYRLALACTNEYALFHGNTVSSVMAAMTTSMNRVNGVYEKDLAVTMVFVANNDTLIYLNGLPDPYTNNNGSAMLGQNVTTINARIGINNYDIGHVFSTGGGGIAGLGVVCGTSKAQGVTGGGSPVGDPFDIDYVAHEMGHQFGAQHTQNNDCNRVGGSAMEPGSASTIMGYAGICSPDVQSNSDDYFHAISLQQIGNFITTGNGNSCPVKTTTGNNAPTVNAGSDRTIPRSTPFVLTATGSDPDGDAGLTYCWEQMDPEFATMPPVSSSATGPLFRSFDPVSAPERYFPRLSDLVSNTNFAWEELPGVARTMRFRVTVRDNFAGASCSDEDDLTLTVAGTAGPFLVTAPNTNVLWFVGETKTVTWDVANTSAAPVSCANVRITLSTDGGLTYPVVLANSVPNNGSATITVPNAVSNTCRVRVEAVGNVFFDISNQNFRIEVSAPTFIFNLAQTAVQVCPGETADLTLGTTGLAGFTAPVTLTLTGGPAGATATVTPATVNPGQAATVHLEGFTSAMAGTYTLTLQGVAGAETRTATIELTVFGGVPAAATGLLPAFGATGVSIAPTLSWQAPAGALSYVVEIAANPQFSPLLSTQTVAAASATLSGLSSATVYYWRVRAANDCGDGAFTAAQSFQTAGVSCNNVFASTNVPINISSSAVNTITSNLNVTTNKPIVSARVTVAANHTWVGDLDAKLVGPGGQIITLFNRPGVTNDPPYGCSGDNLNLVFDDAATLTATDLDNQCSGTPPALSGIFQPLTPLATLAGSSSQGQWQLVITDNFADDGGTLTAWGLDLCLGDPIGSVSLLINDTLLVGAGTTATVPTANLQLSIAGTTAQGVFTVLSLPQYGELQLNGVALGVGQTFTQADIDAGLVAYVHGSNAATADGFTFSAIDQSNNGWLATASFAIVILQNDLTAVAEITEPLLCGGVDDGVITVTAGGQNGNFTYSLNGGAAQASNVFANLGPGDYTVVVIGEFGLTATANTLTLTAPAPITATASVVDADVTVTATGGSGALEYSFDGTTFQSSNTFTGLANGAYTITVRDSLGCTTTVPATVAVNTLVVAATVQSAITCFGAADGVLTAQVAGGTAPFEYSLNGGAYQSAATFAGLAPGTYTITVRDVEGFTRETAAVTIDNPAALAATAGVQAADITVTATGGTGALQYSLDGGATFQASNVFSDLPNGIYTVTVADENGCSVTTQQVIVAVNTLLVSASVQAAVTCNGGANGAITVQTGGGQAPLEYSIDGGTSYQSSPVFAGLAAGTYTVTVKDAQGFSATSNAVMLDEPPAITAGASATYNTIEVAAVGGTGVLQYSLDGTTFQNTSTFTGLANGTYTVTVQDANGCTATATAEVNVLPLTITTLPVLVACEPVDTIIYTVIANGGVPPYEYRINGGPWQTSNELVADLSVSTNVVLEVRDALDTIALATPIIVVPVPIVIMPIIDGNDATIVVTGGSGLNQVLVNGQTLNGTQLNDLPAGQYAVLVTDLTTGCAATAAFTIMYEPVEIQGFSLDLPCGATTATVTVMATAGLPPYQYAVNGGSYQASNVFTGLTSDTYIFTVLDAEGLIATTDPFPIDIPAPLALEANIAGNEAEIVATGGAAPYAYSLDNGPFQGNNLFTGLTDGLHVVTVQDANGCEATISILITGTVDVAAAWGASVLPNPSAGRFLVQFDQAPARLQFQVVDVTGRILQQESLQTGGGAFATELDLTGFAQGVYVLRLTDGQRAGSVRLVVIR